MFIIKNLDTGKYVGHKWRPVDNANLARLFKRRCDAKNSMRYYAFPNCEVIPVKQNIVTELQPYKLSLKQGIFTGNKYVEYFPTRAKAEKGLCVATHKFYMHKDYFQIEESSRPRPSWDDYFLGLAVVISKRSHDIHTQHGCIIINNKTNHILGTGYNGFPRGMQDDTLPKNRIDPKNPDLPNKYEWMVHSEANACFNLTGPVNDDCIAYVTW